MVYVLSHTTALDAMRLPRFESYIEKRDPDLRLPDVVPSTQEIESWASARPLGTLFSMPLQLLASASVPHRTKQRVIVGSCSLNLPPGSLIRINDHIAAVCPELLLLQMARRATKLELILLTCELCGLYAIGPEGGHLIQRAKPLTSKESIRAFLAAVGNVPGAAAVKSASDRAFELCASSQEAKLAARISWRRKEGGYNVPILSMNESLEVRRIVRGLAEARVRRPDILFKLPSERGPGLCLEYKGSNHLSASRQKDDDVRANELLAHGMRQYSIWNEQYQSTSYMDALIDGTVRRELGLARPRPATARAILELARREALLSELNAIDGSSWGTSNMEPEVVAALVKVDEARSRL